MSSFLIEDPFKKPPDFVNDAGVKWWLDKDLTKYARGDKLDMPLPTAVVYFVEEPNGRQTRVLIIDGEIVAEHTGLEDMAVKIEIEKLASKTA